MELPVVLVAEDDDEVVAIIEDVLSDGGFDVATVATAEEGLALITRRADQYKALLTDINLQGRMTGWELAKRAREVVPTCQSARKIDPRIASSEDVTFT